jgi:hypothetical protein
MRWQAINQIAVLLADYQQKSAFRHALPNCRVKAAESAIVTLEGLIQEAAELQVAGLKLNQISAAVAALTAKAKLAGFWVDKQESTNKNYVVSAEPEPTQEEWDEKYVRPN